MSPFLKKIAETYYHNHQTNIANYTFVFPNRRSGLFFQKYLSEIIEKPIFSPQILTINELFVSQSNYQLADKLGLLFRLFFIYKKHIKTDENFDAFSYWGEMLLSDFDDVDKYLIDAEQLFTNVKDLKEIDNLFDYLTDEQIAAIRSFWTNFNIKEISEKEKSFMLTWEKLFPIYKELKEELESDSLAYEGLIFREIAEKCRNKEDLFLDFEQIVFVGFNAITPCEKEIFKYLKKRKKADFYWDYFSPMTKETDNLASFFYTENSIAFPSKYTITEDENDSHNQQYHLIGIPSAIGQTKQVYQILKEMQPNEDTAFKTAVVLPEEKLLLPLLHSLPQEIENINITMGYPLSITPLAGLIDYIFDLQKNIRQQKEQVLFYHKNVLSILNHQYVFRFYEKEIKQIIKKHTENNSFFIPQEDLNTIPFLGLIFQQQNNPQSITLYLLRILEEIKKHIVKEQNNQITQHLETEFLYHYFITIQRIHDLISLWKIEMNIDTFIRLFRKMITGITIPFSGEPLKGLQIMGVLETRALDFENIIILSMNEGVFPKKEASPSFVPYNLRKGFGMPTTEHQDSIFTYHFYRLIYRAKNIYFLYDTRTDGMATGEVSRFIHQLRYHYKIPITENLLTYDISLNETSKIEIKKDIHVMEKLNTFLSQKEDKRNAISASAINQYIDCPLQFYFTYVEKISETDEINEKIEANDFGKLFHASMEYIYNDFKGKIVSVEAIEGIIKNELYIETIIKQAFSKEIFHLPIDKIKLDGQYYITANLIKKYVIQMLKEDKKRAPFEYCESEKKCELVFDICEGKKRVNLKGYIDRVDKKEGCIRIVDYKSGKNKTKKTKDIQIENLFQEDASNNREKEILQILFYAYLYSLELKDNEKIIPSIIFLRDLFKNEKENIIEIKTFDEIRNEFIQQLTKLLENIFDKNIPFYQCETDKPCEYCKFAEICNR